MVVTKSIKIKKDTKRMLDKFKIIPRESYDSVLSRLIKEYKKIEV